jgi:hypothetical protein
MTLKDPPEQFDGERILFWRDEANGGESPFVEFLVGMANALMDRPSLDPKKCVNGSISRASRLMVAEALSKGRSIETYFGHANCRICGAKLGNRDLAGWGFIWPEHAEHYILEHDVWTTGCARLLDAIGTT